MSEHETAIIAKLDEFLRPLSLKDRLVIYEYMNVVADALARQTKERIAAGN